MDADEPDSADRGETFPPTAPQDRPLQGARKRSWLLVAAIVVLAVCTLASASLPRFRQLSFVKERVAVTDVHQETGRAFIARLGDENLSDHELPSPGRLQLIETHRGVFVHKFLPVGDSYALSWLLSLLDTNFPTSTYEVVTELGPAHAAHEDIRKTGNGSYSLWHGYVYFSLPVGKFLDAARLEVVIPAEMPRGYVELLGQLEIALRWIALAMAACLAAYAVVRIMPSVLVKNMVVRSVAVSLALTVALIALSGGVFELYLRGTGKFPKEMIAWPTVYKANAGYLFEPGAEVRWTDGANFWVTQRANSLGFLDWEPVIPKPPGTFRILVVGDSFVEAAQVAMEEKLQTVLAGLLKREFPDRKIDVVAIGQSGTGQSNQLAYFELYPQLAPDLVVLIFVSNDFANASPLLEAIRRGENPEHPSELFMRKNDDGSCARLPIDPEWQANRISGGTPADRFNSLLAMSPRYRGMFAGWPRTPDDFFWLDFEFYQAGGLAPAFEEAVDLTRCSFAAWRKEAHEGKFGLVTLIAEHIGNLQFRELRDLSAFKNATGLEPNGQLERIVRILTDLQVPFLDLNPEFAKRGKVEDAKFKRDGHWNPTGHKWAAESLFEYLKAKNYLSPAGHSGLGLQ